MSVLFVITPLIPRKEGQREQGKEAEPFSGQSLYNWYWGYACLHDTSAPRFCFPPEVLAKFGLEDPFDRSQEPECIEMETRQALEYFRRLERILLDEKSLPSYYEVEACRDGLSGRRGVESGLAHYRGVECGFGFAEGKSCVGGDGVDMRHAGPFIMNGGVHMVRQTSMARLLGEDVYLAAQALRSMQHKGIQSVKLSFEQ